MATGQLTATPGIFHLPITGRRNGKQGVVVAHTAVLDDEFTHAVLIRHAWSFASRRYALSDLGGDGGRRRVYLHRLVFEHYHGPIPHGLHTDHIDRNSLNNVPANLRAVTCSQNLANRGRQRNNTSGFVGVSWNKNATRWEAYVKVMQKRIRLGYFLCREEAAAAVNRAYAQHFPHVPPPNLIANL